MAALVLGGTIPLHGQDGDAPTPGQNERRIDALSERVRALEGEGGQGGTDWLAPLPVIVAAVALLEAVYRVLKALRGRERPVLSWDDFENGRKFLLRKMPDGSTCPAIRVTNVGRAAAVDIVAYVGVRVSAHAGSGARPGTRPHLVGPINPGASAEVPIPLSAEEHERALGGETAVFEADLLYRDMGGRTHGYTVTGMYSGRLEFLEGAVSGALPERARRRRRVGAPTGRRARRAARK